MTTKPFRPMLAGTLPMDLAGVRFPCLASPKLDGIRAVVRDGVVLSRSMKPIPSDTVQEKYGRKALEGADGELIVGDPTSTSCFRDTTSAVMSQGLMSDEDAAQLCFNVFDRIEVAAFERRLAHAARAFAIEPGVSIVPHTQILNKADLLAYEEAMVDLGYEGIMLRDLYGPYKQGRSTLSQGWLLKLKRFEDGEAEVIGIVELQRNQNAAQRDERGYTKRSSHKANQRAGGVLGALEVRDIKTGEEFKIGTGFSAQQRADFWKEGDALLGRLVNYRHFPIGRKDKPRFPKFHGFRDPRDL